MQVFQRKESILGGIDEAIAVLKQCAGRRGRRRPLGQRLRASSRCSALHEGDAISPWETVMTIEGDYSLFAHLETVYLGCLARRTLVMRNVREVVDAAARQADPVLPRPPRPLARADRRRLGGARRRRDRRLDRRAGVVVGRPRRRHRAARADRGLRRRHRRSPRASSPSRFGARDERHRAGRLRQRLGAHGARGRRGARRRPVGRAPGHLRPARRRVAAGAATATRRRRASRAELVELDARRSSTRTASAA